MGYFANGTEADIYKSNYCFKCKHWELDKRTDTMGCPIWDLHILYNHARSPIRAILKWLIPEVKSESGCPGNGECKMFLLETKEGI